MLNNALFMMTGCDINYIGASLNSSLFIFYLRMVLGGDNYQYGAKEYFDKIPILQVGDEQNDMYKELVEDIQSEYSEEKYNRINHLIYQLYNLTHEEIAIIEQ